MIAKFKNKWEILPISIKSSIAFIISSFILKAVAFITTPIFTRIMDTTQYGIIATYNSWVSIIEIFAILGLTSAGVFNVGLNENKENRDKYISQCLGLCNISTFITFIFIIILKNIINKNFILSDDLLMIMFIHFLFSPAQIFWITRQRYEYKYKLATLVTIFSIIFSQIISIVAIITIKNNEGFIKILTNEIGTLVFAIPIYIMLLKKGKDYINFKQWKKILIFVIPLLPHYLAQHIMISADRIMIANMVNQSDAGIYNVVSNIGMIANIFWNSINASLVPYTFENINDKKNENIKQTVNTLLIAYFVVCCGIILIAPEILSFLAPQEYQYGIYAVPPLTVVVFTQAVYNIYANIEFYHKKSGRIALATVLAAITNMILNIIFIPKYSFIAASYTTLASYLVLILMHYLGYKKCIKEKIYDDKRVFILTTILLIFSIICNILYKISIIRYLFILIIIIIVALKYKEIIKLIKSIKKK